MLIITELIKSYHERFQGPLVEDIVTEQLEDTREVLAQIDRTIEQNTFLKHMALAKQSALIRWAQTNPITVPARIRSKPAKDRKTTIL